MKAVSFKVTPELWNAFLAAATRNDTTASQALRAFMRDYVKQHGQADLFKEKKK